MAALPAFAIITAGGINVIPSRPLKGILLSALIPIGFIQFFNLSFNLPPFLVKESDYFYNSRPLQHDWKVKEILEYMQSRYKNREIKIGLFPNCEHFNHDEFILYITLNKLPYVIESLFLNKPFGKNINDCDIVITKLPFTSEFCRNTEEAKSYEDTIEVLLKKSSFENIKRFDLPDHSKTVIYEKIEVI